MTFTVYFTSRAKQDLCDIYDYIACDLQNPLAADGLIARLEKAILKLDEMPERFRAYEKEPWHSRGLRVMPVEHYIVYYIPDAEQHTVSIVRILYGGRNIEEELR